MVAPPKAPAKMPTNVMPICIVDKNPSGELISFSAMCALESSSFANCSSHVFRAETRASSDKASKPFKIIKKTMNNISSPIEFIKIFRTYGFIYTISCSSLQFR
jgi:hypothetical protein